MANHPSRFPSGTGTPGGSDTQVQFNDNGAFGGDAGLTYDKSNQELTVQAVTGQTSITSIIPGDQGFNEEYVNITYDPAKKWGVWIGDDGQYHLDSADAFVFAIAPDGDVTCTHALLLDSLGVKLTGSNGALTILGLGNGSDEDLTLNLNSSNTATWSSSTGVATMVFTSINLQPAGYKSSDGTAGVSAGPFTSITAITVKDGLVTAITGS